MKRGGLLDFLIPDYFQRGKNLLLRLLHFLLQRSQLPPSWVSISEHGLLIVVASLVVAQGL